MVTIQLRSNGSEKETFNKHPLEQSTQHHERQDTEHPKDITTFKSQLKTRLFFCLLTNVQNL